MNITSEKQNNRTIWINHSANIPDYRNPYSQSYSLTPGSMQADYNDPLHRLKIAFENQTSTLKIIDQQTLLIDKLQSDLITYQNNLENCTTPAQMPSTTKGDLVMAQQRMRVCVGHNDDGSNITKQITANSEIELADKAVKAILSSERRKEFLDSTAAASSPGFKAYAEDWLKTYKASKCKGTTLSGYLAILRGHLYPAWEHTPISSITTKDVQTFLDERSELSRKYLHEMLRLMSQIFNSALQDDLIQRNPAKDTRISNPSNKKKERNALTIEELKPIIAALDDLEGQDRVYAALAIYTGMRRGEILGLRWEDIDLASNTISVVRNATYTNNQPIVTTPKTESGTRKIPIMTALLKHLLPLGKNGYVVGNGDQPITLTQFKNMYSRLKKKLPLNDATTHSFRHTMGTLLNDAGADVKTIQAVLGHRDYKTTMDRYVHAVDTRQQEAIKKIDQVLRI